MYKLSYLPIANRDLADAVDYIALDESISRLQHFPYSCPVYLPVMTLEHEYRVLPVKNYIVIYTVNEGEKTVEACRVLHARRDFDRHL